MTMFAKKAVGAALAAAALTSFTVAATPAEARPHGWHGGGGGWHGGGWRGHGYRRGYGGGAVLGAGIAGLAVGAALASPGYYGGYDYGRGYGYGYGYPRYYSPCRTTMQWDPYIGDYVPMRYCY